MGSLHQPTPDPDSKVPIFLIGAFLWAGLIAASSSTVILRRELFAWVHAHVLVDDTSIHRFALFWGASWFFIVKGWHATEFAVLFLLIRAVLNRWTGVATRRNLVVAMVISGGFAASDEYHQTFVPGRGGSVTDVLIDIGGIVAAALVVATRRLRVTRGGTT